MRVENEADLPVDLSVAKHSCQRLPRDRRRGEAWLLLAVDSLTISSSSKNTSWGLRFLLHVDALDQKGDTDGFGVSRDSDDRQ